jgi:hypothetical protein
MKENFKKEMSFSALSILNDLILPDLEAREYCWPCFTIKEFNQKAMAT